MKTSRFAVSTPWRTLALTFGLMALVGCGEGVGEAPASPGTHTGTQALEGGPWECDSADWCRVSTSSVSCGPGQMDAYAWPTEGGGFCIQRFACGPDQQLCSGPILP